jgi:uncharacterized membrane protein YhfC
MHLKGSLFYLTIISGLPLSYLINQIKLPISVLIFESHALDLSYGILWVLIVGLTEESIKFVLFILIIVILTIFKIQSYRNSVIVAFCVGIGFGIGEIWYLSSLLIFSNSTAIVGIGWLAWLGGFGFERFFVTFGHAAMFIIIIAGFRKNNIQTFVYLVLAILLHALYDLPIILNAVGLITSLELTLIIVLELIFGFIASFFLLDYFLRYQNKSERNIKKFELLKRAQKKSE